MSRENIDKSCMNCINSNGEYENCFCIKKGRVDPSAICKKYKMDLLKLKPRLPLNLGSEYKIEL